ncbi:MAG: hypothetical protein EPO21_04805 [Chloroflexota bacterium]|nr:MAG: hypothetical protein EPO21_04805 [Chloroflexota bacterium]
MNLSSKIVRNSITNYGGNAVSLIVGFLLTPFLVHSLGDAKYGAWVLVGSISSYFWLLDFGLGSSVTKFVSELHATGQRNRLNAVVASSFALLAAVGLVSLIASGIVAQLVDILFRLPSEIVPEVRSMIYVTGVALAVSFPFGVFGGVLRGYQRYDLINVVVVVSTVANAILSVLAVKLGWGLVGLALVGLSTNLVVGGGRLALSKWVDRGLVLRPSMVKMSVLRGITGFSVWIFVINVAVQVVYRTSPVIIASVLGVALVTPFAIANSLVQYSGRLVDPILAVLLPAYSELSAVDDTGRVRRLFIEASKVVGAIAMPVALGLLLLGKPFIVRWVGPTYEESGTLLYFLVPPLYLSFMIATGDKLLWAKGKIRVNSYVAIADAVLNLSLSVTLAMTLGLVGVALATFLSVLITNGLGLMPYICHESGLSMRRYLILVAKPLLTPALPATGVVLLAMRFLGSESYLQIVLLAALCAISYWSFFLALNRKEDTVHWLAILRSAVTPSRFRSLDSVG